jgi:O-ureido-D-serine cyclo-ligase
MNASAACWDDTRVRWDSFDLAILRSTWDYVERYDEFFDWLACVDVLVAVHNPPERVRWSANKRYLRDLEAQHIPIVPTIFIEPGELVDIPDWADIVVKPAIGAGGKDAARHTSRDGALQDVQRLTVDGRTAMVQEYMTSIDDDGETGLVYFNGKFNHAFKKSAILKSEPRESDGLYVHEMIEKRAPTEAARELADSVVAAFAKDLLYARVDVVPDAGGNPMVLEVELAEPSFFLEVSNPGAADAFALAVQTRLPRRAK